MIIKDASLNDQLLSFQHQCPIWIKCYLLPNIFSTMNWNPLSSREEPQTGSKTIPEPKERKGIGQEVKASTISTLNFLKGWPPKSPKKPKGQTTWETKLWYHSHIPKESSLNQEDTDPIPQKLEKYQAETIKKSIIGGGMKKARIDTNQTDNPSR